MYEPLAAIIIRQLSAEVATSALPNAPVRTERSEPAPRLRAVAPSLRRRTATMLVGLAGRLDPGTQTVS